jgi:hypothetical protein
MKKIALVVLAAMMGLALLLPLTACLPNNEKVIRDALTTELDKFKDPDSDMWTALTQSGGDDYQSMGISIKDLATAWSSDFSYEIGEIKIDGNKATAEVTINCKQFYPATTKAVETLLADETLQDMTSEEIEKKTGQVILDELTKSSLKTTKILTTFTLIGNVWTEDATTSTEYAKALLGEQ